MSMPAESHNYLDPEISLIEIPSVPPFRFLNEGSGVTSMSPKSAQDVRYYVNLMPWRSNGFAITPTNLR